MTSTIGSADAVKNAWNIPLGKKGQKELPLPPSPVKMDSKETKTASAIAQVFENNTTTSQKADKIEATVINNEPNEENSQNGAKILESTKENELAVLSQKIEDLMAALSIADEEKKQLAIEKQQLQMQINSANAKVLIDEIRPANDDSGIQKPTADNLRTTLSELEDKINKFKKLDEEIGNLRNKSRELDRTKTDLSKEKVTEDFSALELQYKKLFDEAKGNKFEDAIRQLRDSKKAGTRTPVSEEDLKTISSRNRISLKTMNDNEKEYSTELSKINDALRGLEASYDNAMLMFENTAGLLNSIYAFLNPDKSSWLNIWSKPVFETPYPANHRSTNIK